MNLSSFPKIYNLGKREIQNIFLGDIEITEKIDGSQFAFGIDDKNNLIFRSKGQILNFDCCPKMFIEAKDYLITNEDKIRKLLDKDEYIYGEYLQKEKHNVLNYARIPKNHIIVFGVKTGQNFITKYDDIYNYAIQLDLEAVPLIYTGIIDLTRIEDGHGGYSYKGYDFLKRLIETTQSILGNELIEGIVIKNYNQHTTIGEPTICCGKYVRESFKERHRFEWKTQGNKLDEWLKSFKAEGRWQKALIHLKEKNELDYSPKDIGKLMKEIHLDINAEEKIEIQEFLYKYFIDKIHRTATAGVAEWYKNYLLRRGFENEDK